MNAWIRRCLVVMAMTTFMHLQGESLPVVMIADLGGTVLLGHQPVALAEGIPVQRSLTLKAGSRLVVINLKTGEQLAFSGPGGVRFDDSGNPLGLKPAERRKAPSLGQGFQLEPGAWAQASMVMRKEVMPQAPSLETEEPMPFHPPVKAHPEAWLWPRGTAVLTREPELRWQLANPAPRLTITDDLGNVLIDGTVEGGSFRLTGDKALEEDVPYRWRLSWMSAGGQEKCDEGWFRVLPAQESQTIQNLRPVPGAPFADRLAYAVALESHGLADEAQPYWKALAAERPGDTTLRGFLWP